VSLETEIERKSRAEFEVVALSDLGAVRTINEDSVYGKAFAPGTPNPWGLSAALLVADGLGGHDSGEVASGMARSHIHQTLNLSEATDNVGDADLPELLAVLIQDINREIHAATLKGTGARPATTLTLCVIRGDRYHIGHVGDTRAFLIGETSIRQITEDDTWVGDAIRRGKMTPEEADRSPFRGHLMKAVGLAPSIASSYFTGGLAPGDLIAVCSDGLSEYVKPEEMWHEFRYTTSLEQSCEVLIGQARERGGHDNISLVACGRVHRVNPDPGDAPSGVVVEAQRSAAPPPSAITGSLRETVVGEIPGLSQPDMTSVPPLAPAADVAGRTDAPQTDPGERKRFVWLGILIVAIVAICAVAIFYLRR
jgi:protein phosphatase